MRMLWAAVALAVALGCGTAGPTGDGDAGTEAALREVPPGADAVCGVFVGNAPDCGMPCGTCRSCYHSRLPDGGPTTQCFFVCPPPWANTYTWTTGVLQCCRTSPAAGREECFTP